MGFRGGLGDWYLCVSTAVTPAPVVREYGLAERLAPELLDIDLSGMFDVLRLLNAVPVPSVTLVDGVAVPWLC